MGLNRPDLTNIPQEVIEYVKTLENALHGSSDLTIELNITSKAIAEEIKSIRESGKVMENDKFFDKVLSLIKESSKIRAMSDKKVQPEKEDEPEKEAPKVRRNIQDFVIHS